MQPGASVYPAIAAALAAVTETVLGDIGDLPAVTLAHVDTCLELPADAIDKVEASARSRFEHDLARLTQLLEDPGFVGRAPAHVVASKLEQLARTLSALTRLGA